MVMTVRARALGAPGKAGTSLRNYAGHPPDSFGNDSDYCIDTVHEVLLGPKAAGAWPNSGISLVPGQPAWCAPLTSLGVVNSTTPEHVIDSRAPGANGMQPNDSIVATVLLYIPPDATNDEKFVRFCVQEDSADSLLHILPADVVGLVEITATLCIKAASPHALLTLVERNGTAFETQRDDVVVSVAAAIHLQTRLWLANAADQVVVDAIYLRLNRTGL